MKTRHIGLFAAVTAVLTLAVWAACDSPIPVSPPPKAKGDFNTLSAAGNTEPHGIWSDGTTMWVANYDITGTNDKIYAYNMLSKKRDESKEFNTLQAAGNTEPHGIWSDGTTMWVSDAASDYGSEFKIYAYSMSTKKRAPDKDFNTLSALRNPPFGIWSNGTTMWAANRSGRIHAYNMRSKARDPGKDFDTTLRAAGNNAPFGMWSSKTTVWIVDMITDKIYAYNLSTKKHEAGKDFDTLIPAGNVNPLGLWSDGETMWVADGKKGQNLLLQHENQKAHTESVTRLPGGLQGGGASGPRFGCTQ